MKMSLFAAMSLDGFIADSKGSEDFLADEHWKEFTLLSEKIGCFIVSRKAYDVVNKWEAAYGFDTIKAKKIIVSKNKNLKLKKGYLLASSPKDALNVAKLNKCKGVLVAGGGHLNSAFLDADLIDELVLTVEPCILGKGIGFFTNKNYGKKLKLIDVKKLDSGLVKIHYDVVK